MITVADWDAVKKWELIPDADEDGEIFSCSMYFEDDEFDRYCAVFDCIGSARIEIVNEDWYKYISLSPEILTALAKMGKKARKLIMEQ